MSSSRRGLSTVTDTLTSDVVTTSTGVLNRSNTSNSRRRKPCAISMRVEVMSTTVTPRLQASAVSAARRARPSAVIIVPGDLGPPRIENPDRDVLRDRRQNRARDGAPWRRSTPARMPRRTTAAARARGVGDDARIGGEHAVDVGPDLNLVHVETGAEDRRRIVRPAAAERRRDAGRRRADEAAEHRHLAGGRARAPTTSRVRAQVASMSGTAAVCSASVTSTCAGIDPGRRNALRRRTPPPRSGCWPARPSRRSRRATAATPRDARASVRTVSHQRGELCRRAARPAADERSGRDERRRDADVPLEQVVQELRGFVRRRPPPASRADLDQPIGHLRHRRDDDDRRRVVRRARRELVAHDGDDPVHRLGVGDRGAAELHDDVHSRPSRCISSAFRIAAPAAPRIVLWPSAMNL